jgi:anti-anti-sigma factor
VSILNSSSLGTPQPASTCHTAHFATQWLDSSTAIVTAHGEIDAVNAFEFAEYSLQYVGRMDKLVVDLTGIKFFGSAGFSALHALNVRCAANDIRWAMAPSKEVSRLLRICDPDATLPVSRGVNAALAAAAGESPRLLQLVAEPS